MSEARYTVFSRTWWKHNSSWPNGREPCIGNKRTIRRNLTEAEARQLCKEWNAAHAPGPLSRKAEYQQQ
jgi:hypothetical protein